MHQLRALVFIAAGLLATSAWSAGVTFEWTIYSMLPSGQPASNRAGTAAFGTLTTVDGKGGPGDSLTLADIASFQFTHEWEDTVTSATGSNVFSLADLISLPQFPLIVSADGTGFDSGTLRADNGTNVLRMIMNAPHPTLGDVSDNYVVDEFAQTGFLSNGWNGGGFGGWVNTAAAVPLPGAAWLLASALAVLRLGRRPGLARGPCRAP